MIVKIEAVKAAAPLFDGWQETTIWSCLQKVMGEVYGDHEEQPRSAMTTLGDFCYFAGEPQEELVLFQTKRSRDGMIFVPQNDAWAEVIARVLGENGVRAMRYGLKKEPGVFDEEKLARIAAREPEGYAFHMIDEALYDMCRDTSWCRDFVANFADYEMFETYALGVVAMKDGEIVSGASSYSAYLGGIEIEIVTREEHRRRGLAAVCAAKLILACLERGLYPSWDAQTRISEHLAQTLGYQSAGEYEVYILREGIRGRL